MAPTIEPGDVCLVRSEGSYVLGDVILCSSRGSRVLHRVVVVGPRALRTKGDANTSVDREPIPHGDVDGRVVAVFRVSRWLGLASDIFGAKLLNQSQMRQ